MILHRYSEEKFCPGDSQELKDLGVVKFLRESKVL